MQKLDNLYVSDLEFEDDGMRGPKGESGDAPSLHIEKIAPFLYQMECRSIDYDAAETYVRKYYPDPDDSCAVIRKGSLFGRNYDGGYDNTAEFVLFTPARNGKHRSLGVGLIPGLLTTDLVDAEKESDFTKESYKVLPCFTVDGFNDAGVAVAVNRMPDADEDDLSDDSGMCALFAVRYVLDHADSAEHAVELLSEKELWFPQNEKVKAGFYLLISDGEKTFVADLKGHAEELSGDEYDDKPILTNFRTIGWDGTPAGLELHANGIERYDILDGAYEDVQTDIGMIELLKSIRYTGIYDTNRAEFWYSDYNGDWSDLGYGDLTINSAHEDYAAAVSYSVDKFENRERDGKTKQTLHTAVYDTDLQTLSILVQEEDNVYHFCLDEMALLEKETERAKAAEEAIRRDFENMFYTKSEVDDALQDLNDDILETVADGYYTKQEVSTALTSLHEAVTEETDAKLEGKADVPENEGDEGQVLYRTETGAEWGDLPPRLPDVTIEDDDKVMAVENGVWVATDKFADYIHYINMIVSVVSDNGGVPTGGIIVTIKDGSTGDIVNQAEYLGQPVTFRVPRGMSYIIEQSGKWEGYHNPTPDKIEGAATTDISAVFTYEAIKIPETLRELQIIVDGGNASTLKEHIGLQFADTFDDGVSEYEIVWDLKDVIQVFDEEGNEHSGVILQWHNATPVAMPFDAAERLEVDLSQEPVAQAGMYYYGVSGSTVRLLSLSPGDPLPTTYDAICKNEVRSADGSVIRRGYSRYNESVPRKWLNSNQTAGHWWNASHVGDMPPEQAYTVNGFMHGCSEQILSMVKPVRVRTAISASDFIDTYDKFFIPSIEEVYGVSPTIAEGVAWEDWIIATGFAAPSNNACAGRRTYPVESSIATEIGLRSENVGYQYITWDIKNDGSLDGYVNATTLRRYAPCCVIYK